MGWRRQQSKEPNLPLIRSTSYKHISPAISTHGPPKMHHKRTRRTIKRIIHTSKKWNIRQVPVFQMSTKRRRISWSIPLTNKEARSTMQLGTPRRKLGKKYIYTGYEKSTNPNGFIIWRQNTQWNTNYALARERGQANQQRMHNSQSSQSHIHTDNPWFEKIQYIKRQNREPILPTPQTGQIQNCRRCGNKFLPGHLNVCPAKTEACRTCKKIGHFAKQCRSEMPSRPKFRPQQRQHQANTRVHQPQRYNQLAQRQTQQKNKNINEEKETEEQTETDETIDPESTCYIREMMEDWQKINFITSMNFTNEKVADVNKTKRRISDRDKNK